jgi:hypothetical protein
MFNVPSDSAVLWERCTVVVVDLTSFFFPLSRKISARGRIDEFIQIPPYLRRAFPSLRVVGLAAKEQPQ